MAVRLYFLPSGIWWAVFTIIPLRKAARASRTAWRRARGLGAHGGLHRLGGANAPSRSLFSQLLPVVKEAQYYSLYTVGERGTSWLGPLVFAGIGQVTGSFRYAISALTIFLHRRFRPDLARARAQGDRGGRQPAPAVL
jgi:MFS-type transporter involved in bile tolerance (Atg22 family)